MPFPVSHPASPLTSVQGITNLLQPEKHVQMVKVSFPPCAVIDPQEPGGPLPNGALREEKLESGFRALILTKHDFRGPTIWEQLKAFQHPTRTHGLIHMPYSAQFSSWLASRHPGSTLRCVGEYCHYWKLYSVW